MCCACVVQVLCKWCASGVGTGGRRRGVAVVCVTVCAMVWCDWCGSYRDLRRGFRGTCDVQLTCDFLFRVSRRYLCRRVRRLCTLKVTRAGPPGSLAVKFEAFLTHKGKLLELSLSNDEVKEALQVCPCCFCDCRACSFHWYFVVVCWYCLLFLFVACCCCCCCR